MKKLFVIAITSFLSIVLPITSFAQTTGTTSQSTSTNPKVIQFQNYLNQKYGTKPTTTPTISKPAPTAPATDKNVSAFEQRVLELTNAERTKQGLKPLILDTKLSDVARTKSQDMSSKGYFSHTSPTYGSPFDMMKKFGITYKWAAENIAKGQKTPETVVRDWMNSPGHRANILSTQATHIGIGHEVKGNLWTQMFIKK